MRLLCQKDSAGVAFWASSQSKAGPEHLCLCRFKRGRWASGRWIWKYRLHVCGRTWPCGSRSWRCATACPAGSHCAAPLCASAAPMLVGLQLPLS